jgi:hypothetical protein
VPVDSVSPGTSTRSACRDAAVLLTTVPAFLLSAWFFAWPWVGTNLLVLGWPLLYLWTTSPKVRQRLDWRFSLFLSVFGVIFTSLARRTSAWASNSLFPFAIPGQVTVEELQWILLYFPLALAINERFFPAADFGKPTRLAPCYVIAGFWIGLILSPLPQTVELLGSFSYWKIGAALYFPTISMAIWIRPSVVRELIWSCVTTGPLHLGFEALALENDYWTFPGRYLGRLPLGRHWFPLEELIFLILLSGPSLVAAYAIYQNWRRGLPVLTRSGRSRKSLVPRVQEA